MVLLMVNGFTFIKTEMFGLNQITEMELKLAPGLLTMRVKEWTKGSYINNERSGEGFSIIKMGQFLKRKSTDSCQ